MPNTCEVVVATFQPQRTDDLRSEGLQAIGLRTRWRYLWVVDEEDGGPYVGEWVLQPADWNENVGGWVPERDLVDFEPV